MTPLLAALCHKRTKVVDLLLARGAGPDARSPGGWGALHIAAERDLADEVRRFWPLLGGRDSPATTPARTAMQVAAEADAADCVIALTDLGADPGNRAGGTASPLILVIRSASVRAAVALLGAGADHTATDPESGVDLMTLVGALRHRIEGADGASLDLRMLDDALGQAGRAAPKRPGKPAPASVDSPETQPQRAAPVARPAPRAAPIASCAEMLAGLPDGPAIEGGEHWSPLGGRWPGLLIGDLRKLGARYDTGPVRRFSARRLPFYDTVRLIRLNSTRWDNGLRNLFFLDDGTKRQWLDGRSDPVHQMNLAAPVTITGTTVLDYLRFFCFFLRSDGKAFHLAEDAADPLLAPLHAAGSDALVKAAKPATILAELPDGTFVCRATVFHGNTLCESQFRIGANGSCEMIEETLLAKDLPVQLDLPPVLNGRISLPVRPACPARRRGSAGTPATPLQARGNRRTDLPLSANRPGSAETG